MAATTWTKRSNLWWLGIDPLNLTPRQSQTKFLHDTLLRVGSATDATGLTVVYCGRWLYSD
jgi:hypothetical protein